VKRKKKIFARKCDFCKSEIILNGPDSDSFVVTAEYKYFCMKQTPGQPAEKDCMADYLNNIKKELYEQTIKKELEEKEKEEKKQKEKEEKIKSMPRVLAKLDKLQKEFKDREWKRRLSKYPS
jgi:cbb3-type cytochrome oxidase cytochrome c subunit